MSNTYSTNLHAKRTAALKVARDIVEGAKAANRDLTPDENTAVAAKMTEVENLDKQIKGRNLVNSVYGLGTAEDQPYDGARSSIFSESAAADLVSAVKSKGLFRTEVSTKAALSNTLLPPTGRGVEPGLYPNTFPLATLFRTEQAPGPAIRYYVLGGATAEVVPEFGLKPDAGLTITPRDVLLTKVATTVRFSDEFAEDASFLLAYLEQELTAAVVTKENAEILAAFASTSGVLTRTGATDTTIDVVADAIAGQEGLNGATPTAVVVNPTVLATIRKAKAGGGGDYFVDPLSGSLTTIHGVRVVSTPATPPGTAWVVGGPGVVIYRRGQITAEISWAADDFLTNQRTLRVEERFATAVVRPSMLTRLTLT
jgi:HK97 family phage major capsid protein